MKFQNSDPNNTTIYDPTWVKEADVSLGQIWDTIIFVFYMNQGLFWYQDHGYSMFHSKIMMISNSQLSLVLNSIFWDMASWIIDFLNKSMAKI